MLLLSLFACQQETKKTERSPIYLEMGQPYAGVSEGAIDFPIGAPMGGYSSRCNYLGDAGAPDNRQSQYALSFPPTVGIQTSSNAKVLWLEAGNSEIVLINVDVIYIFDGMIDDIESELSSMTGKNMDGKVMITASHTHNAPANFSDQIHFYLGGDRFNREIYTRFVSSVTEIAMDAYESKDAASIGISVHKDWDPDDLVYRDRRENNNELAVWDDVPPGYGKDPYLWMLRIDHLDGTPMGVFFNFGIHGTSLGDENAMISSDAPGHIERALEDWFDTPVVVSHFQGAGGDVSPAGTSEHGSEYARMEGIGQFAAELLYAAWEDTPTASEELKIESVTHAIPQGLEVIEVRRDGEVDWHYNPYEEGYIPDDIIFDDNGEILSPLDEFNAKYGAAFCGYDDPLISTGTIGAQAYPYNGCMQVELVSYILNGIFSLDEFYEDGEAPLPLPDTLKANTSAARLGPVSLRTTEGEDTNSDILVGFFPGEVTGMYAEQFRRRSKSELGYEHTLTVGYAQDHEGYLLIPEDWLAGGYESNINVWGPLQGEHIMEGNLKMAKDHLETDFIEPQDLTGEWGITAYPDRPIPDDAPDETPLAGTASDSTPEDLYTPIEALTPTHTPETNINRVQGVAQFIWEGGDPGVDSPLVILEYNNGGTWEEVQTASGRSINQNLPDILLAHLPTPLYPYDAMQSHQYWVAWQAVGSDFERVGIPLGEYRFHIYGQSADGLASEWPWPSSPYELTSPSFMVEAAEIDITIDETSIIASINAPDWGYRLIDVEGSSHGGNPVTQPILSVTDEDGSESVLEGNITYEFGQTRIEASIPSNARSILIEDFYGNTGLLELGDPE